MEKLKKYLYLIRINFKISVFPAVVLAIGLMFFSIFVFNLKNVDSNMAIMICEEFITLIGIVMFGLIYLPESKGNIEEVISSKKTSIINTYIIRIAMMSIFIIILLLCYMGILKYLGGTFEWGSLIYGTTITAIYLGAISLFCITCTNQLLAGYMISLLYFIFDMMTKGRYTGNFTLFSMTFGYESNKNYLLITVIILLVSSLVIYHIKRKIK